jgi:protein Hikeshi
MDAPEDSNPTTTTSSEPITLGISLESSSSVSAQMAALQSSQTQPTNPANPSSALVVAPRPGTEIKKQPDTLLLAQRIIKNAFNFLASFSGNIDGGVEVVPLKAFEEWWRKFEGRVRNDPGFLERDGD